MGKNSYSLVAKDVTATDDEIEKAIEELTVAQKARLLSYANLKIALWSRKAKGYDGKDLLSEAITQILEGRRRWRKNKVEFFWHIIGAIRSIASHFGDNSGDDKVFFESEVSVTTEEGETRSPIDKIPSLTNQEEDLAAKQYLEKIMESFSDDTLILEIIGGLGCGMSGPEIQEALDISKKEYETAMKRMRRNVLKISMAEKNDDYTKKL